MSIAQNVVHDFDQWRRKDVNNVVVNIAEQPLWKSHVAIAIFCDGTFGIDRWIEVVTHEFHERKRHFDCRRDNYWTIEKVSECHKWVAHVTFKQNQIEIASPSLGNELSYVPILQVIFRHMINQLNLAPILADNGLLTVAVLIDDAIVDSRRLVEVNLRYIYVVVVEQVSCEHCQLMPTISECFQ